MTGAGALAISRSAQNGLLTGTVLGNVTDSYTYNSYGEVSQYIASYGGSPILSVQYDRDDLGRIVRKTETTGGATGIYEYGYDLAGRLNQVEKDSAVISEYTYDPNGNRLSLTTPSGTVTGTYDDQDRLLSYGNVTYTYSLAGELKSTKNESTSATTNYVYDELGNLVSVTMPDGTLIEYVIDGQNRRIGKKVNGTLVQGFLYENQLRPVAELDGSNTIVSRFVYATKVNVPEYMIKNGVTYRIITDHLGSPRLVINVADGTVVQRVDYDEFGNVTLDTNSGFQPFGSAGGLLDQQTKLTRFGARDYDAAMGRWTVKDPILFTGGYANVYAYSHNDSINAQDASGLYDSGYDVVVTNGTASGYVSLPGQVAQAVTNHPYFRDYSFYDVISNNSTARNFSRGSSQASKQKQGYCEIISIEDLRRRQRAYVRIQRANLRNIAPMTLQEISFNILGGIAGEDGDTSFIDMQRAMIERLRAMELTEVELWDY